MYPEDITEYLELLRRYRFPLIDIQTNALDIGWLVRDGKPYEIPAHVMAAQPAAK